MPDAAHSKPRRLARAALIAAIDQRWNAAERAIQRVSDECGGAGLGEAILAWTDAMIHHATAGQQVPFAPGGMDFADPQTGQLNVELPAEVEWAGRLLAARAAMDQDRYRAVLAELPDDPAGIGLHVWRLIEVIGMTIRGLPSGYALMGRTR